MGPQEEFIIPLLKSKIEFLLTKYEKLTTADSSVLDVGCGCQPFRQELESLGYQYRSFDVQQNSESSVEFIGQIDSVIPSELLNLAPFDLLFCTEVMEHVPNWDMAFNNFYKLLKPGGQLLITCPFFYPLHEEPYDFWRPTPYALSFFGEKYNFELVYQENLGDAWDVLGTLLASSHPVPLTRSLRDRIITKLIHKGQQILFQVIKSRYLQTATKVAGNNYLSNIVVFEKNLV